MRFRSFCICFAAWASSAIESRSSSSSVAVTSLSDVSESGVDKSMVRILLFPEVASGVATAAAVAWFIDDTREGVVEPWSVSSSSSRAILLSLLSKACKPCSESCCF